MMKMMRICAKRSDSVFVEGEQVEKVDEFTYLGSIFGKERQAFTMLRPIWRSTVLQLRPSSKSLGQV